MEIASDTSARIWGIQKYPGKRGTTYRLRWRVHGQTFSRSFTSKKQAEVFRSGLVIAVRDVVPLDPSTGLPRESSAATSPAMTWLQLVGKYLDAKWPTISPRHRKSIAESLTNISLTLMEPTDRRQVEFERSEIATTLTYGFFSRGEAGANVRPEIVRVLISMAPPAVVLRDGTVLRKVQHALSTKLDGSPASERTTTRKRATLNNILEFGVELGIFEVNPLPKVRQRSFSGDRRVDPRVVVSTTQGEDLLAASRESTPQLTAYFALLLQAGMRPAEARSIRVNDLELPRSGWGRATLSRTEQRPGSAWTNDASPRELRGLKHRPRAAVRTVPLRPVLVATLREHLHDFETGVSGELFTARTGKAGRPLSPPFDTLVSENTIYRAWSTARSQSLAPAQLDGPLGRRPYDLRHACLTDWLNSGVPPAQVAAWAGHSVRVLLDVYAGCVDGGEQAAMDLIDRQDRARDR